MGAIQNIHLTMQPTRPGLAGAMRILDGLKNPTGWEIDASKAHRGVLAPQEGLGLAPIMGPIGLFYANAVGTFGVVSGGRNLVRLASAAVRWELDLAEGMEFTLSYFTKAPWYWRGMGSPIRLFRW